MSFIDSPARLSAFGTALIGPMPITSGSTPAVANVMKRARGLMLSCFARSALISNTAAAPSENGLELPAVTVPGTLNAGLSFASASSVVSGRGGSSRMKGSSHSSFFAPFQVTFTVGIGTI